jgi:hypothetical protein
MLDVPVGLQVKGTLSVIAHQILELRRTLSIHKHSLPEFRGLEPGKVPCGITLTNGGNGAKS